MKKSWGLLPRIVSGEKVIESRWSKFRSSPFNRVKVGDRIYFKDSGEPISLEAEVDKVLQFEDLTAGRVREILERWGAKDGIREAEIPEFFRLLKDKRYCVLVFLKDVRDVKPFQINKRGFGVQAAWICTPDVEDIKAGG